MTIDNELTINQLRKIFTDNGLEFLIVEHTNGIAKVNFIVKWENEDVDTLDH